MGTQRLRAIAYEIFKTLNDLNLNFTTKIFHRFLNLTYRKDNLYVHSQSTIKFGKKQNLKVTWGTHMKLIAWKLKINIKSKKSPRKFKHFQIRNINAVFAVICKLTKTYYTQFHQSTANVSLTEKPGDGFALARCVGEVCGAVVF